MLNTLKAHWHELRKGRPGHRFQDRYERDRRERKSQPWYRRLLQPALLVLLILAGVILCFIPGPGIPLIAIGAALLADYSRSIAQTLDWLELRIRKLVRRIWSSQPV